MARAKEPRECAMTRTLAPNASGASGLVTGLTLATQLLRQSGSQSRSVWRAAICSRRRFRTRRGRPWFRAGLSRSRGALALPASSLDGSFFGFRERLIDSKILAFFPRFDLSGHPSRHGSPSCPRLNPVLRITVLGGHLPALDLAPSRAAHCLFARRKPAALPEGGKLTLQLASFAGKGAAYIVAQLDQRVDRHRTQLRWSSHLSFPQDVKTKENHIHRLTGRATHPVYCKTRDDPSRSSG